MTGPISNGPNGDADRDGRGRFKPGWRGGPGSPVAKRARQIRQRFDEAMFKVCSPDRLLAALDATLKLAEAGDVQAMRFLADRIGGTPVASDVLERLERLEQALENNGPPGPRLVGNG
jgi:hypothetical protein